MDESAKSQESNKGPSRDMTDAEKMAAVLQEAGKKLIQQERRIAKCENAFADLSRVLQEKTYIITNLKTGEKHVTDLDEVFSGMVQHFVKNTTLEGYLETFKVEKVKPETAAILYGQKNRLSKQRPR